MFYNNTLYNKTGVAVAYSSESEHSHFCFYNNIFVAANELLKGDYTGDIFLAGDWWSLQCRFKEDGLTNFTHWANEHDKEKWNGKLFGLNINPSFINSGHTSLIDVTVLSLFANYKLQASSPLYQAGIDLQRMFNINTGKDGF